jgi:Tfp pilus assembly protein PilO
MRFITPIILIIISITLFFSFTNPLYNDISSLKTEVTSYNEALDNSKALENERDKLTAKYNAISPDNLMKLQKLLPDNVDNIRLILEIEQIALPYGMALKDVKYNVTNTNTTTPATGVVQGGGATDLSNKDYGIFDLEFSVSGSYDNFINFTKDLESNLRIVDISSIDFSSDNVNANTNSKTPSPEVYKYDFKIKTYWLKN